MIDMGPVNMVRPDVCYLGGLRRALRVAKMAAAAGLPVWYEIFRKSPKPSFGFHRPPRGTGAQTPGNGVFAPNSAQRSEVTRAQRGRRAGTQPTEEPKTDAERRAAMRPKRSASSVCSRSTSRPVI
jgi:hypothetical protein